MKLLSIITINRNNSTGLKKTIESVFSQNFLENNKVEFIIIDGASSDASLDVITTLEKERMSFSISFQWYSEPDTGIYNAMNKGVMKSSGRYCLFLNSGDCLFDNSVLTDVIPQLENSTEDIISAREIFTNGYIKIPLAKNELNFFSYMDDYLPHQSTFIKKDLLTSIPYHEDLKISSDYIFFIEALFLRKCSYTTIENIISLFDTTGISATNSTLGHKEIDVYCKKNIPEFVMDLYKQYQNNSKYFDLGKDVYNSPLLYLVYRVCRKIHSIIK